MHQTVVGQNCSTRRLLDQSIDQLGRESPVIPAVCVDVKVGMMCAHNSPKVCTWFDAEFRNVLCTMECDKSTVTIKDNVHQICQLQFQTPCMSFAFQKDNILVSMQTKGTLLKEWFVFCTYKDFPWDQMYSAVLDSMRECVCVYMCACYLLVGGEYVDHEGFLSLVDKVDGPFQSAHRHDRKQRTEDLFLHDL